VILSVVVLTAAVVVVLPEPSPQAATERANTRRRMNRPDMVGKATNDLTTV